jgi:hypothetical protein
MARRACLFVEPLMIDLTSVPATQNPSSPMMVCTTTMAVVTAATDGWLASPLRECAMGSANAQNGTIHRRMRNTPTRRRNGDRPADFVSSVADDPSRIRFPTPITRPWAPAPHSTVVARYPIAKSIRPPAANHGLPQRADRTQGRRATLRLATGREVQQTDAPAWSTWGHRWWPRQPSRRWTCAGAGHGTDPRWDIRDGL